MYTIRTSNGKRHDFDLTTEVAIINSLMGEIISEEFPANSSYYLKPEHRKEFLDLYSQISMETDHIIPEVIPPSLDKKRRYLPGRRDIKMRFEEIYIEVEDNIGKFSDVVDTISLSNINETTSLTREGSKQIRINLFILYRWLSNLQKALLTYTGNILSIEYKIRKCKFLIYSHVLVFRTGNLSSALDIKYHRIDLSEDHGQLIGF